ncbi:MAG: hypothetical protein RIE59_20320, partial [Imperialibacter sp.]
NRGSSVTINLLVENLQGEFPIASFNILYKSVKVIKKTDQQTEANRTLVYSLAIGTAFFVFGLLTLIGAYPNAKVPLVILFALSFISSLFGLLILQIGRWIKKLVW